MAWENQELCAIEVNDLTNKVQAQAAAKARLVQIGATKIGEQIEINYSFDQDMHFTNYRITVAAQNPPPIASISSFYLAAALYENELQDLYGLKFEGLALNYNGQFYKKAARTPFNPGN
ncbi:MAG: NADH-quinone oxidoreductase subunit C [Bacteriovoracaceae bacterium]|nr:NADH-quinone oxidoreductase subunit C [Bacteriovoracaceae bacterium]